ncbi:ATP-binding protein [Psychroserpens sp. SPM9]|uniref:ATP-binding response regulator n=1 Tax=Psychroserpens sp. SPM9 TaxID=2975598 RepID=UPI0021A72D4E|nr:ATP-binding protein [Psychroserpens sp. SPM9]MDG5492821.1 ATP-binding protein [Psychroserpens sp. SPM9]
MKANLLFCFLLCSFLSFGQTERALINKIDSINAVALHHYNTNDIAQSFKLFNQAIKLSDSINDSYGQAEANFTIGKIYDFMHEYEKAEASFTQVIKASRISNDNFLLASSYLHLGKMYMQKKPPVNPIPYFEKALFYAKKQEVRDQDNTDKRAVLLLNTKLYLAEAYLEVHNSEKALIYLSRAADDLKYIDDHGYSRAKWNYIKGIYFFTKAFYNSANMKFANAVQLLEGQNAIDASNKHKLLSDVYKNMSLTYAMLEKDKEAYNALISHNNYRDRFLNEDQIRQNIIVKSRFLIENYKNVAQLANNERIEQLAVNNKIKNVNVIISITIFLLIISLLTMYRSYMSKRKLSNMLRLRNVELETAKNQAEKSSELKSNFISNVTHELRTPLYGVVGLTSILLKNNNLSEKDSKFLKSLKYSGDYLLNLVNDILQIGKIESQKIELKNVTVNIRLLLENLVNSFDYRLEEANNKIQITVDKNVPEFIKCDNVRMSQVLINLIGNSIKFTENGKIDVRVKLLNIEGDYVSLSFEVEDDGPGIPKEKQKMIFENFSQLDKNNNTNYQGTGLGLPITKNIIELFGSTLEVESELGLGTTFSFELTFEIDRDVKSETVKTKKLEGESIGETKKYKILVAEDNKINQIVTQNLLQKENYECVIATNGKEALEAHKQTAFDLILMDINMPVMNGNESTKAIREFDTRTPIIALTAADIDQIKTDYKCIGFDGIITKPFDNYEFFQTISEHIEKAKSLEATDYALSKVS